MSLKFVFLFAFLSIQVSCEDKGSLALIIDDTESLNVLYQIRNGAKEVLDTILTDDAIPVQDVLVVTFNDPVVKLRTRTLNRRLLRQAMTSILPDGGSACPEMSLSGIKKGLEESRPGSYLYVFTGASAKDNDDKFEEVKSLCLEKKSKITFVLTGDCGSNSQMDQVYNNITEACGGDVIKIEKDQVFEVFEYIKEYLRVARNVTTSQKLSPSASEWTEIKFRKDHITDYVLVSVSGTNVELSVVDQEGTTFEDSSKLNNFKVMKLKDLTPGQVTVKVRSASSGQVIIYSHTARARWLTPGVDKYTGEN